LEESFFLSFLSGERISFVVVCLYRHLKALGGASETGEEKS